MGTEWLKIIGLFPENNPKTKEFSEEHKAEQHRLKYPSETVQQILN